MKLVSILGDSISTFEGFNPPGYAVYYDKELQALNGLSSVCDTWWAKVIRALQAHLCMNNSYSGSLVTGDQFPAGCSDERIDHLCSSGCDPDIILVYLGFNDFGYGVRLENRTIREPLCFSDAYDLMLKKIKQRYPPAVVVCGTLMRTSIKDRDRWTFPEYYYDIPFESYNEVIRKVCGENNGYLADIGTAGARYETLDGAHPTVRGHKTIAEAWIRYLKESKLPILSPDL